MWSELDCIKADVQRRGECIARKSLGMPFTIRYDKNSLYEGTIAEAKVKVVVRGRHVEGLFIVRLQNARGELIPGVFCVRRVPNPS